MDEPDQGAEIGRYAGWGSDEDARQPPISGHEPKIPTPLQVHRVTRSDKLGLLLIPCWLVALTVWEWLHNRFGVAPWVGWASMGGVALVFVVLSRVGPGTLVALVSRKPPADR